MRPFKSTRKKPTFLLNLCFADFALSTLSVSCDVSPSAEMNQSGVLIAHDGSGCAEEQIERDR